MADSLPAVAIDTGGTFTDVVARWGDRVEVAKVPSTPHNPALAVHEGMKIVLGALGAPRARLLIHGTTVATNALLEGVGGDTWFVVNQGFEDLLRIGRQHRAQLYALEPEGRPALVPRDKTVGVAGRRRHDGTLLQSLDLKELKRELSLLDEAPRSWAICLLHSYADMADEEAVAALIRELRPDDWISVSSRVLPVFREVERASTTVANAFVMPLMQTYLGELEGAAERVDVMGSSGGRLHLQHARDFPVHTALSGPAGGVVAALATGERLGTGGVISFDMGGTSTDVALCAGTLPIRYGSKVGEHPIHVPMLAIHTIGAGGGSIAFVDDGGALRVGPRSAGADPGPACYGRGTEPTVTDANVVLGRLPRDVKLGGRMPIQPGRAFDALGRLAKQIGAGVEETAEGILRIAVEKMAQAIRKVSTERGVDPRLLPLCSFGGAGGLHACALADVLGMTRVIVPPRAGLLSAAGMLQGSAIAERSRTVLGRTDAEIASIADELTDDALRSLAPDPAHAEVLIDMRYAGQSFELTVLFDGDFERAEARFDSEHVRRFGYRLEAPVERVTLRIRAEGPPPAPLPGCAPAIDDVVSGPQALVDLSSTTWVAEGWTARTTSAGDLLLEREAR